MRNILLPLPGDPFLFNLWMHFYYRNFKEEADQLVVLLNTHSSDGVVEYIESFRDEKVNIITHRKLIDHGDCIDMMLDEVDGNVCLIEDDCFVTTKGFINAQFAKIESGEFDAVGSSRGSCSVGIYETARAKFNLDYNKINDVGCNFWPSFFFINKKHLIATDRNFKARMWKAGEIVEPLGRSFGEDQAGDTFVNTSLQLHAMGLKFDYIPQYHCRTDDYNDFLNRRWVFNKFSTHLHVGSLSSAFNGFLMYNNKSLGKLMLDYSQDGIGFKLNSKQEKREFERRISWLYLALDYYKNTDRKSEYMDRFSMLYEHALNQAVKELELEKEHIELMKQVYSRFLWK